MRVAMRLARPVAFLLCLAVLAGGPAAQAGPQPPVGPPSYLRLPSGTWALGGVDDLIDKDRSLLLLPVACQDKIEVIELGVGFVIAGEFSALDVAGTIGAKQECEVTLGVKNFLSGLYDVVETFKIPKDFLFEGLTADSATYKDRFTSEVEMHLSIRCPCCHCGPPPTKDDDVSVQELTIGPTPVK